MAILKWFDMVKYPKSLDMTIEHFRRCLSKRGNLVIKNPFLYTDKTDKELANLLSDIYKKGGFAHLNSSSISYRNLEDLFIEIDNMGHEFKEEFFKRAYEYFFCKNTQRYMHKKLRDFEFYNINSDFEYKYTKSKKNINKQDNSSIKGDVNLVVNTNYPKSKIQTDFLNWLNEVKKDNKQVNLTIAKVKTRIDTYKIFQVKDLLDYAEANNLDITNEKIIELVSPDKYSDRSWGKKLKDKAEEIFSNQFLMGLEP
ncbi:MULTISPECIES: hypothetical protein [unclassified Francisella]|uniref:hypothetical protein n=1 Tax=unclassified Francisella TaxID=2610885 RepID=UPI002E3344C8|nr:MULTISPECIES: hypothetical protein [unclassified Francisella]MED7820404.1 hypothetical protein [Francisella sp. 19S2-4]MED7831239.1 hypothetical protein [Francisella sp. 19S2-10]